MPPALQFRAGPEALARIRRDGLTPAMISHLGAAAGGPKWLMLGRLDRVLFGEWLPGQTRPIVAVGASIGSWRLACAAQRDPLAAMARFEEAYLHQRYAADATAADVGVEAWRILRALLGASGAQEIPGHPWLKLNIVAARGRGWIARDSRALENLALGGAMLANLVSRRWLGAFVERALFHPPGYVAQLAPDGFRSHRVELTADNVVPALMASACIPGVIPPTHDIPGAPAGGYVDGGMVDYHMDLDLVNPQGLMVLPHFSARVVPGWLDKFVPWRKPRHLARTLVIAPSPQLVATLHGGRIPDRKDFQRYDDDTRERAWGLAVAAAQRMAEEFRELAATQRFADVVQPLAAQ